MTLYLQFGRFGQSEKQDLEEEIDVLVLDGPLGNLEDTASRPVLLTCTLMPDRGDVRSVDFTRVNVSPPSSPRSSLAPTDPIIKESGTSDKAETCDSKEKVVVITELSPSITVSISPLVAQSFSDLIKRNAVYSQHVYHHWTRHLCVFNNVQNSEYLLRVNLTAQCDSVLDYTGGNLCQKVLWMYIELEDALHWLSTLGGAYSNLGEHNMDFALKAGKNALKQLVVAQRFGDSITIAKCWLFVAMSQMQQNELKRAARIVKIVFNHTKASRMKDLTGTDKIVKMCHGIWARIRYEWKKSRTNNRNGGSDSKPTLEVECKFAVPHGYEDVLVARGFQREHKTKTLRDVYYDTTTLDLMRKDQWLRVRNGVWELKYPMPSEQKHKSFNTIYSETSDESAILEILSIPELPICVAHPSPKLPWAVLADIVTHRENWKLGELTVVVDRVEPDLIVGEIEQLVSHQHQVEAARDNIQTMAASMGFVQQWEGKMDYCLRTQKPEALALLKELYKERLK